MDKALDTLNIKQLRITNPQAYSALERCFVSTYEEFIESIYTSINWVIKELQENPQHSPSDSEDQVTRNIVSMLRARDFNAYSDAETGGHVDIRIDKPGTDYLWLGEAKKDSSTSHVHEGFLQLTTRYATCAKHQTEGGILIYIFKKEASDFIEKCRNNLAGKKDIEGLHISEEPSNPLIFHSESCIPRMGKSLKFRIRHMGISVYFLPEDKSGRESKKYKKKRESGK